MWTEETEQICVHVQTVEQRTGKHLTFSVSIQNDTTNPFCRMHRIEDDWIGPHKQACQENSGGNRSREDK
jgi:hypothetical protein